MRQLAWVLAAAAVVAGIFYEATRSVRPLAEVAPQKVTLHVFTTVDIDPDGTARMASTTTFTEPPVLVTLLRHLARERPLWLESRFDESVRKGLAEQPWETGEIAVAFDDSRPRTFVVRSQVTLYRYAWVEDEARQLWYSPGVVTRQDGIAGLVDILQMFGQRVASVAVRSEGIAYWPAAARIVETLPRPGGYVARRGDVEIRYHLNVYRDERRGRPVVQNRFDIDALAAGPRLERELGMAFDALLAQAQVKGADRTVFIRYEHPIQATTARPQPAARTFDRAPYRWPAAGVLVVLLAGVTALYVRLRKEVHP